MITECSTNRHHIFTKHAYYFFRIKKLKKGACFMLHFIKKHWWGVGFSIVL